MLTLNSVYWQTDATAEIFSVDSRRLTSLRVGKLAQDYLSKVQGISMAVNVMIHRIQRQYLPGELRRSRWETNKEWCLLVRTIEVYLVHVVSGQALMS